MLLSFILSLFTQFLLILQTNTKNNIDNTYSYKNLHYLFTFVCKFNVTYGFTFVCKIKITYNVLHTNLFIEYYI